MKLNTLIALQIAVVAAVISGCSSKPTRADIEKDLAKAEQVRMDAEEDRNKKRQRVLESDMEKVPKWAFEAPKPDAHGVYAIGSGMSDTLSIAMKKAMLDAEFGLAKATRQEISGSERIATTERGQRNAATSYTALIDKLVARVPVVGYEVVNQETLPVRGTFNTWVMLKMPYAEFNRALQDQRAESTDRETREAFDDLERRVKARQEARLKEEQARQEMRMKAMDSQASAIERLSAPPVATESAKAQ